MSKRTRKVSFSRWEDILKNTLHDFENQVDNHRYGLVGLDIDEPDEVSPNPEFASKTKHLGPIIVGPHGIIPLTEGNCPSTLYNMWMMHTNFNISTEIAIILESLEGIESLNIYSRYRCRISIGKMFDEKEILEEIRSRLCDPPKSQTLEDTTKYLKSKYPYWALLTVNKTYVTISGATQEECEEKISAVTNFTSAIKSWESQKTSASQKQ